MRAITVIPGKPGSVGLADVPEPPPSDGPVLVETQAIGVCGTDVEIIDEHHRKTGRECTGHAKRCELQGR